MRQDFLDHHLSRRGMLSGMGALGAAATANTFPSFIGSASAAEDVARDGIAVAENAGYGYDDAFSIEGAKSGAWAAATRARYGPDDERGTINEITPRKTAEALALLRGAHGVETYTLGQSMADGLRGFATFPPRVYSQRITVLGFQPANPESWFTAETRDQAGIDDWRREDLERGPLGYLQSTTPVGLNEVSSTEERFLHGGTYQIGTQFDHFPHFGVGDILYNGWRASDICTPTGFTRLGVEKIGPFVTRGILIDVLGWKQAQGGRQHLEDIGGHEVLGRTYRITIDDLQQTLRWQGVRGIDPGDVVLIRTGWHALSQSADTIDAYFASAPGIYIAEAKWLGDRFPAVIGSDTWGLEVMGNAALNQAGWRAPVHQELLVKRGVHIGESIVTDALAAQGHYRFVYAYTPQNAVGATAGNAPPMALVPSPRNGDRP